MKLPYSTTWKVPCGLKFTATFYVHFQKKSSIKFTHVGPFAPIIGRGQGSHLALGYTCARFLTSVEFHMWIWNKNVSQNVLHFLCLLCEEKQAYRVSFAGYTNKDSFEQQLVLCMENNLHPKPTNLMFQTLLKIILEVAW